MCAIVDNNVRGEVFGQDTQTEAGKSFLDSLGRNRQLVVGGKLLQELSDQRGLHGFNAFSRWLRTAIRLGHAKVISKNRVDTETLALQSQAQCRSNDEHIIALARVSGARLLFTNDLALQKDFTDHRLVGSPRGRIYTTAKSSRLTTTHKSLLRRTDLCAT